jgi:hypothetical protein
MFKRMYRGVPGAGQVERRRKCDEEEEEERVAETTGLCVV